MSLISDEYVKTYFPLWSNYFLDDNQDASETVLSNEIIQAENEFLSYINVDSSSITDSLKLDLLNIVKYRGFSRRHGDTVFEPTTRPMIMIDYQNTIKKLASIKSGELAVDGTVPSTGQTLSITSKPRKFDKWLNYKGD